MAGNLRVLRDDSAAVPHVGHAFRALTSGQEQQLHAVLAAIPDVIVVLDANGRYRAVYTGDPDMLVKPAESLVGRSVMDVLPRETAGQIQAVIAQTVASGAMQKLVYAVEREQGDRWLSARVVPFGSPEDPCVLWAARDITERKLAEDALRAAESRLVEAQRIGRIGSWDRNLVTGNLWWSAQMYDLFDVDPAAFRLTLDSAIELIMAEDREHVRSQIASAIEHGRPFSFEYRVRRRGGDVLLLTSRGQLKRDAAGKPLRLLGTVQDITEQRRIQARVQRAERLASLGVMAAGIAHEINNPIFAAWAAVDAALTYKSRPEPHPSLDECLQTIASAVQRCQAIVKNVLMLARQQSSKKATCDLNSIVTQAAETVRPYARLRHATVTWSLETGPLHVTANAVEIEQVLVNLVRNSVEAGANSIAIAVESAGNEGRIQVRDNGRGISSPDLEHIFDPFFTRGENPQNSGLGLPIAHAIINDHGGHIDVESKPGSSTTFTVRLPLG